MLQNISKSDIYFKLVLFRPESLNQNNCKMEKQ